MVCYDCGHLFAPVRHAPFSWDARRLETSSPACPLLAYRYASSLPWTENVGRAGTLDARLDHRLAGSVGAPGRLFGYPCPGSVVGRRSPADFATVQGWHALSRGGWECQTQTWDEKSLGPKRTEK